MTLAYFLVAEDYITHQLYTASKSERIKKQRRRSWLWLGLLVLLVAFTEREKVWDGISIVISLAMLILSIIFILFYQRYYYKRHYIEYILDIYKNNFELNFKLAFNETNLEITDSESFSTLTLASIEQIDEIKDYFFLQIKQGGSIIVPKRVKSDKDLNIEFRELAKRLNIKFNSEPNWKWK